MSTPDLDRFQIKTEEAFLLTIDLQERLINAMYQSEYCLSRSILMLEAARILNIPGCLTEQYPKGLGKTVESVREVAIKANYSFFEKVQFSSLTDEVLAVLKESKRTSIIITGIEAHICVFQTVRELLRLGYNVFVAEDAISSRTKENRKNGLKLLKKMGAVITNTETILFDMLQKAGGPTFKEISKLVK